MLEHKMLYLYSLLAGTRSSVSALYEEAIRVLQHTAT